MTAEERAGSFHHKKVGPRAAIVAAGPIANFILAIVIFTCLFTFFGKPSTTARVDKVEAGSAAEKAGFQAGDVVTAIDGKQIGSFSDMQRIVGSRAGEQLTFHGQARRFHAAAAGDAGTQGSEGLVRQRSPASACSASPARPRPAKSRPSGSIPPPRCGSASRKPGSWSTARWPISAASSPGAKPPTRSAVRFGSPRFPVRSRPSALPRCCIWPRCLSISIGLLNLFPVPLLDGGHLLFYAVEAVRGRPLSERAQEMGFRIGLGLVLMLMVFATYNDILHLAAS